MSLIDLSSPTLAASVSQPDARAKLASGRMPRRALENLGLFIFGFGSASLLIHIAVGFFLASRMPCWFALGSV
ncbi:MAG: hypothetical protein CTY15_00300 [Methylocystis sp.]|nr:MAG: hypothetical protein CTY15_00300 [Methylocystis sp.]